MSPELRDWQLRDRFLEMHSRWFSLIGEHLEDTEGRVLEYWRVEKADSVIILPIQGDRILLPQPSYRPGIGKVTLDFPGGRVPPDATPETAALTTLERELGIDANYVTRLISLNEEAWAVNSSFSNQKLYGFVALISDDLPGLKELIAARYPATGIGVLDLLQKLDCLQCRAVLQTWWLTRSLF